MAAVTTAAKPQPRQFPWTSAVHALVLVVMLVLVLLPVALILVNSFRTSAPGQPAGFSLDVWRLAFSDPALFTALWNTLSVTVAEQLIALPIAIALAWLLARTDLPGSRSLEFMFWVAFFLPALPVTVGWIMLMDPDYGLLNALVTHLPFVDHGPFNIYSFWGIVWSHLGGGSIAIKVMLLTPAFRSMDASLEEASRMSGASSLGTLVRIVIPIMLPVLSVVLLLSVIHAFQAFEQDLVLGLPFGFYVFGTQIYAWLQHQPPNFQAATALSSLTLVVMVPFIVLHRWMTGRQRFTTVTGRYKGQKVRLGRWRWPGFVLVLVVALIFTVVPFAFLLLGTFMKLFGFFEIANPWTTDHWAKVLGDPVFLGSLRNTLAIALGTAATGLVAFTAVAYIVARTRFRGRAALDFLSWLPSTLPGIILGVGMLWLFLSTPLIRSLYGTLPLLVIAMTITSVTTGVQLIKGSVAQLGVELEEAARVGGGGWWAAFRHVVLPLISPTLLLVFAVTFVTAARNVSAMSLLATTETRPLSLLQLDYMVEGRNEAGAVVGVIVVALTTGVALLVRLIGRRVGLRQ